MDYKTSKYNFIFPYEEESKAESGKSILYNSRTGALALIENEQFEKITEDNIDIKNQEIMQNLVRNGFLVDDDVNELEVIKYNVLEARFSSIALNLTIAPTLDCNFRCIYCYEKNKRNTTFMSLKNQELLIDFVKDILQNVKYLNITWYGGEPLLAIEIIEKLSEQFIALCREKNVNYTARIITNGYLLTKDVAKKFRKLLINDIQITIDGNKESHDKRRFLEGNKPTFDQILENIREIKQYLAKPISIRINADKYNVNDVDDVIKELQIRGLDDCTHPYLAMVDNINGTYDDNGCLAKNEFSDQEYDFAVRNRMNISDYVPEQINNYCCADCVNSYVIDPDGLMYKCWKEIGMIDKSIGSLADGVNNVSKILAYMLYDPTTDGICEKCKYLPICMGGCPNLRQNQPESKCTQMKHSLKKYISVLARTIYETN